MATTQINLTEHEYSALRAISQQTGKTQEELINEAIDQLIIQFGQKDRRALLQKARGLWKDRQDIPAIETLRSELDRF